MVKTELRILHCRFRVSACFQLLAVWNSCSLPSFGSVSKSALTNGDNCSEVKWTIPHLLRHKMGYPSVKVHLSNLFIYLFIFGLLGKFISQPKGWITWKCTLKSIKIQSPKPYINIIIHQKTWFTHIKEKKKLYCTFIEGNKYMHTQ